MPNVLGMYTKGRKNAFKVQIESVIKVAEKQRQSDTINGGSIRGYCDGISESFCPSGSNMDITDTDVKYVVVFNPDGTIRMVAVENSNYCYANMSGNTNINTEEFVDKGKLTCNNSGCSCTSAPSSSSSEKYVYWKMSDSGWDGPETTHDSIEEANVSDGENFVRSTVDSSNNIIKNDACLKYNVGYFCLGNDYWVEGDLDGSLTLQKMENEMESGISTNVSCDLYYGDVQCEIRYKKCKISSDGYASCRDGASQITIYPNGSAEFSVDR